MAYESIIKKYSNKYNVSESLIKAVIQQESGFNPKAGSSAGAKGLMQLMPGTFNGLKVGNNIYNPDQNIHAGVKYLSQMLDKYGDRAKALAAYNGGPGHVDSAIKKGGSNWRNFLYNETKNYIPAVNSHETKMKSSGTSSGTSTITPWTGTSTLTSKYGWRSGTNSDHKGNDYQVKENSKVNSVYGGTVLFSGFDKNAGNYIKIRNPNGNIETVMHLNSRNVKAGDKVNAGQSIGLAGNTGNAQNSIKGTAILHYQLQDPKGVGIDSDKYLKSNKATNVKISSRPKLDIGNIGKPMDTTFQSKLDISNIGGFKPIKPVEITSPASTFPSGVDSKLPSYTPIDMTKITPNVSTFVNNFTGQIKNQLPPTKPIQPIVQKQEEPGLLGKIGRGVMAFGEGVVEALPKQSDMYKTPERYDSIQKTIEEKYTPPVPTKTEDTIKGIGEATGSLIEMMAVSKGAGLVTKGITAAPKVANLVSKLGSKAKYVEPVTRAVTTGAGLGIAESKREGTMENLPRNIAAQTAFMGAGGLAGTGIAKGISKLPLNMNKILPRVAASAAKGAGFGVAGSTAASVVGAGKVDMTQIKPNLIAGGLLGGLGGIRKPLPPLDTRLKVQEGIRKPVNINDNVAVKRSIEETYGLNKNSTPENIRVSMKKMYNDIGKYIAGENKTTSLNEIMNNYKTKYELPSEIKFKIQQLPDKFMGKTSLTNGKFTIRIQKNLNKYEKIGVLRHEIEHIKDKQSGFVGKSVKYKEGKTIDEIYTSGNHHKDYKFFEKDYIINKKIVNDEQFSPSVLKDTNVTQEQVIEKPVKPVTETQTNMKKLNEIIDNPEKYTYEKALKALEVKEKFENYTGNLSQTKIEKIFNKKANGMIRDVAVTEPMKPVTEPMKPVTEPMKPVTEPMKPVDMTQITPPKLPPKTRKLRSITSGEKGISKGKETIKSKLAEEQQKLLPKQEYNKITNKKTWDNSVTRSRKDFDGMKSNLINKNHKKDWSAQDTSDSQVVIRKLLNEKKYDQANDFLNNMTEKLTKAGQSIQALAMWNRMTPDGAVRYYTAELKKARDSFKTDRIDKIDTKVKELRKTIKKLEKTPNRTETLNSEIVQKKQALEKILSGKEYKQYENLKLTAEDTAYIKKRYEKMMEMPDGYEKNFERAKVNKYVADKLPVGTLKKIASIQTIAQLFNPKTMTRNIVGNIGGLGVRNVSDVIKTGIDIVVPGERTKFLPSVATQVKGGITGAKRGYKESLAGVYTQNLGNQYELQTGVFKSKIGKFFEKGLGISLRTPDMAFANAAYEQSALNQAKALLRKQNKKFTKENIESVIDDIDIEKANIAGLHATFQDKNRISDAAVKLKKGLNLGKDWGFGDLLIKYAKTPANLIARGIDYSPVSIIRGLTKLAYNSYKGNKFDKEHLINNLGDGLTGGALVVLGAALYNMDIITGAREKSQKIAGFLEDIGQGSFSINLSALKRYVASGFDKNEAKAKDKDNVATYDWFQPVSTPISAGTEFGKLAKDKKIKTKDIFGAVALAMTAGINTLEGQSMLQGINRMFKYGAAEGLTKNIEAAPSSFVPTLVSQARKIIDENRRLAYNKEDTTMNTIVKSIKNKMPGYSKTLPKRYKTSGEEDKFYKKSSGLMNFVNVFISPSNMSKYNNNESKKLLLDIYRDTGETKQLPRKAIKSYTIKNSKGEQLIIPLTNEEQSKLQRYLGVNSYKVMDELMKKGFEKQDTDQQIKLLNSAYNKLAEMAKYQILKSRTEKKK